MEAQNYAGEGKVYSKVMNLDDVAWIDSNQGQVAVVPEVKYSTSGIKKGSTRIGNRYASAVNVHATSISSTSGAKVLRPLESCPPASGKARHAYAPDPDNIPKVSRAIVIEENEWRGTMNSIYNSLATGDHLISRSEDKDGEVPSSIQNLVAKICLFADTSKLFVRNLIKFLQISEIFSTFATEIRRILREMGAIFGMLLF